MGRPVPANGTMANGRSSFQDPSSSAPRQAQASSFADLYNGGLVASQSNRANGHARTGSRPSATMSNQAANNRAFTLNAQVDNDMPGSFGNSRRGSAAAAPQSYASSPYGGLGDDDQLDSLTQHLTLNGLTNHRHTPSYSQFGDDSSRPYAPSQASWLPRLPRNGLPSHSGGDFERRGSGQSAGFPQSVSQQPSAPRAPQQPSFNLPQQPGYYQQPQPYNDLGQQLLHLQAVQSLVGGNGHYATQNMAYANAAANQTYSDPTYGGMGLPGFSLANGAGGPIGYSPTVAALAQAQAQAQTPQGLGMNHVAIQRASGHGTAHPLTSSTLSDFKANRTSRNWTFNEIWGHLAEFSGDQHGSRLVQQLLSDANSEDKERAFCELEPNAVQLMRDVFGNYVVQKFFEYGTQVHKRILADKIRARIFELSIQTYACRVVQVVCPCPHLLFLLLPFPPRSCISD